MALHYQANLVDDVTVGASLTLKNQHGTKRQLQTICVHVVCVCVCVMWCVVCGVCLAYEFNSSEQNYFMTQQLQTVHYVHTQGYGTQEISLYAGLPRRQAVLIHSTLRNCGGRRQIS